MTLRLGLSGVIAFKHFSVQSERHLHVSERFLTLYERIYHFRERLISYMSGATTISMKSKKNKKLHPSQRDEAYARGSTLLPSDLHKVRRSSRLANGLGPAKDYPFRSVGSK